MSDDTASQQQDIVGTEPESWVNVYSTGICYASICAARHMTAEDVEREVNAQRPTGLDHGWKVADEPFRTGEANPHDQPCGRHWLLVC